MTTQKTVLISLELPENQAIALAQFIKRVGWSEMRGCAVNDNEAYEIKDAVCVLQNALAEKGYAPR